VDEQAIVDVRPSSLDYTGGGDFPTSDNSALAPGESRTISDEGFEHVDISNIGSVNIEEVTAEADMPNATPFAGSDTPHNTGNLITMSTETANSDDYTGTVGVASDSTSQNPHYLTRVEYVEENPPEYIQTQDPSTVSGISATNVDVGRFRVGDLEYFFVAYYNDGMIDTGSDYELRIGRAPHTSTVLGTTDFTSSGTNFIDYTSTDVSAGDTGSSLDGYYGKIENQEFVVFDPDEGSNSDNYTGQNLLANDGTSDYTSTNFTGDYVRSYNLFTHFDSGDDNNHIQRTRFNTQVYDATTDGSADGDRASVDSSAAQRALLSGTGSDALNPGQNVPINIGVQLPQGIDASDINSGIVRFVVTADETP
jgi:hypothetical protein